MAKKKDKKDKEAKKARALEKSKKAQSKSEEKNKKKTKKLFADEEDDVDIDTLLAQYAREQEELTAITVTVTGRPSRRMNPTLVTSPVHQKKELILFGGESNIGGNSVFYNDLYTYSVDSDTWRKYQSKNAPMPRSGHAMCVHPTGSIVLFGGDFSSPKQNTFYHYGDTWVLDAQTMQWEKIESRKGPSPRSGHRMTYWKNFILLHGGFRDLGTSTTYLNDLWAFDVSTFKWTQLEFPSNHPVPDERSGHSFIPTPDGAVLWGGYSKVKAHKKSAGGAKTSYQKGKTHTDMWVLKMKPDLKQTGVGGITWERRKKQGFAPSPRVGCSMVHHKGRGILFGGVYDTEETEESLASTFFNSLFAYHIENNRWFSLTLRQPKKKRGGAGPAKAERDADLEKILSDLMAKQARLNGEAGSGDDQTVAESEAVAKAVAQAEAEAKAKAKAEAEAAAGTTETEEKPRKEYPVVSALPHPRFNAACTVCDDTLYIFGGIWENGEKEYTLDSFYAVDLGRLDGVKVFWEDLAELEEAAESEDEEEDGEDDGDDDDDGEDDGEALIGDDDEEEEEEIDETVDDTDARPWLPQPKPFESLKAFYERTGPQFVEWALSGNRDSRGKDLKKLAFDMCEDRFWERREVVRQTEDEYEEMGGIGEVIDREGVKGGKRR